MGAIISFLWAFAASSYAWLFPQNVLAQSPQNQTISAAMAVTGNVSEVVVGSVNDFTDGEMKELAVGKEKILIVREGDNFSALGSKCTHSRQSLKNGAYHNGRIRCSWHGACFSTATGDIEDYPACESLPTFPLRIENGQIIVRADAQILKNSAITKPMRKRHPSDQRQFIIIGGGPAGATAAETLRAEGYTGRLIVISRENTLPYDRTKLSKVMNISAEKCQLRDANFYNQHDIEFLLGIEVKQLDSEAKSVTLSNGDVLNYDQALIATGADSQRLPFIPGHDATNVHVLRTVEDANRIVSSSIGKNVLIVGSSFIGMEVASCIVENCKVTVIGMEKVPFERVLGREIGRVMLEFHESRGVKFIMDAVCDEFKTSMGHVTSVVLKNGTEIKGVDMVVIGAGVIPATSYIKPSPKLILNRDKSITVDQHLFTGAEGLWAAGDLAKYPFSMLNNDLVRIEHWGMAQTQGHIAAKNMAAGVPKYSCKNIPFFWTMQYGKSVRYCGHALYFEEVIIDKAVLDVGDKNFGFVAYYIHNGTLLATCSLNRDPIVAIVAELMHAGIPITEEELRRSISIDGNADKFLEFKLRSK